MPWPRLTRQVSVLYRYRVLLAILVQRDLKGRYRGTALGMVWSFMNPLLMTLVYMMVFSVYLRIKLPHYPVFLLSGLLPWNFFVSGLTEGCHSLIANGGVIKKVYLPAEVFPLAMVCGQAIHFLFSIPILLALMAYFGIPLGPQLVVFPFVFVFQLAFVSGLALIGSALAVRFRDILYILPTLVMLAFFGTPIFYSASLVPDKYRLLVSANPLFHLISSYQAIFYDARFPSFAGVLILLGLSAVSLVLGLTIFESQRDHLPEYL